MRIMLVHEGVRRRLMLSRGTTIAQVAARLRLNQETHIIKLNERIAHPVTRLREGDWLEFVDIIYGG